MNFLIKHRFPLSLITYELVISIRIIIEMGLCALHTFIHQLMWFNIILLIFFICFNKILKVEAKRLWLLSAGSLLTFIPIIFSYFAGHKWALNYIEPQNFLQVVKNLFTLLCCHDYNWPMFPELLLLLSGSSALAYYFSKDIQKSFLCSFAAFYSSFLLLGFSWIATNPDHPTLLLLESSFSDSKFYSLQMITIFIFIISIANYKDLKNFFMNYKQLSFHALNLFIIVVFYSIIIYLTNKPLTAADNIVTVIPILFISYTIRTLKLYKAADTYGYVIIWVSFLSIIAMLTNSGL